MNTKKTPEGESLKKNLQELKGIVEWFEQQSEVDVEIGLEKVRKGSALVKTTKARLVEIENEFKEIERDLENEIPQKGASKEVVNTLNDEEVEPDNVPF